MKNEYSNLKKGVPVLLKTRSNGLQVTHIEHESDYDNVGANSNIQRMMAELDNVFLADESINKYENIREKSNMKRIIVKSQEQLDKVPFDFKGMIFIKSEILDEAKVRFPEKIKDLNFLILDEACC